MEHKHSLYLRVDLVRALAARKTFKTPDGGPVTPPGDVSLAVRNNARLTLLGPAGFGKTTLLKTIAGFDSGEIFLGGQPMGNVPAHRRPFNAST